MKTTLKPGSLPCQKAWMKSALFCVLFFAMMLCGSSAVAQIAFRGSQTSTTTGATLTITKPSGLAVNDLMLANIAQSNNNSSAMANATRAGWTLLASGLYGTSGNNRWHVTMLYKIADAADVAAGSYNFGLNAGSDDGVGGIVAFSGVDTATPFDVAASIGSGSAAAITVAGLTTVTPNSTIVVLESVSDNINVGPWSTTSPGALTEAFDEDFNSTEDMQVGAAYAVKATAGPTGNLSVAMPSTEFFGVAMVALRPVTISTGTIAGAPFCAGNAVSVPYTINGPYNSGNVFTAQLSNASGSFASPVSLGTVTSTAAGTISGTIPTGTATGTGYRVRVISSSPAATGTDNGVNISINGRATAVAGSNMNTCSNSGAINITAGSSATNAASVLWTSSGTGTFANANSMTLATYTPSALDISNGSVVLTLTSTGNAPCSNASSNKTLTIFSAPTAAAGGSQTICQNGTAIVSGASSSNGTILWTENGQGTITAGATTHTPTYTAAAGDAGNTVTLTMTVSNAGCASATATYTVNVIGSATANAGTAVQMCSDAGSVNVTAGATSTNNAGVLWTSSGSGSFTNDTSLTLAEYTPSGTDISNGSVTLTLTAFGNTPCANATSLKTLTFKLPPTASAGGSTTVCQNQNAVVSGASSSNGTILWTENGQGSITAGATTLTPTYTPAAGDAGNTVTLTMTVSNSPCAAATASYTVNVLAAPTAMAGDALSTCANSGSVNITAGATASNHINVMWTSSGTGSFTNADSLTLAEYVPSTEDIADGSVTLTLTATGNSPCASVTSTKVLTILPVPVTTDAVICAGGTGMISSATVCPDLGPSTQTASGSGGTSNATSYPNTAINIAFPALPANAVVSSTVVRITFTAATLSNRSDLRVRATPPASVGAQQNDLQPSTANGSGTVTNVVLGSWSTGNPTGNWLFEFRETNDQSVFGFPNPDTTISNITITVSYTINGVIQWYTASTGGSPIGTGSPFNPVGVAGSGLADTMTAGTTVYYAECSTVAGCRTPVNFTINALPEVTFSGLAASYCEDAAAVLLSGNHSSGVFSGPGVTSNGNGTASFNPATAGVGTHSITYTYTDGNSCPNSETQSVDVDANVTYYQDFDGDGFGNLAAPQVSCIGTPAGYVLNSTDCDDIDNTKNSQYAFYVDADGDGIGTGSLTNVCAVNAGTPPANYSLSNTDCNDADDTMFTTFQFYTDGDGDGFGAGGLVSACAVDAGTPPTGYSLSDTDCDDSDSAINEVFDFYVDADGDGFGTGNLVSVCAINAVTPPTGYSLLGTDCNDAVAAINPGHVEVLYNGIDDNCDSQLDEGFQWVTQIAPVQCGATLVNINSLVAAVSKPNSTGYRFEVTNTVTNAVQVIDRPLHYFALSMLAQYDYATTYSIRCEIQRNGIWLGYFGPACLVSTPAVLDPDGAAQIAASQCGVTLSNISTLVATNSIQNVTSYRFRVTNLTDDLAPNQVQSIDRPLHWFALTMLPTFNYGTSYMIEVAVKTNGVFSGFGSPCIVNTPAIPTLTNCGQTIPTSGTLIATTNFSRTTSYRFEVTNLNNNLVTTIDRPLHWFSFNMIPGYEPGAPYGVRIALMTSGGFSPFGDVCEIIAPGAARPGDIKDDVAKPVLFSATAYPNPFDSKLNIAVSTEDVSQVNVKVYDMTGRLLDNTNGTPANEIEIGERYPAGVYNVIVTQGENTETIRVIKR